MAQIFANNVSGVVAAGGFAQSATTLSLTDASAFPDPGSDWYLVTLSDPSETEWEIVKVTAKSGNDLTVVRAQEGTSDIAWDAGDTVEMRLTAGSVVSGLDDLLDVAIDGTPAANEVLAADGTGGWSNRTAAEAGLQWDGDPADVDFSVGVDIGEALVDADEVIVGNGADATTGNVSTLSQFWTYISGKIGFPIKMWYSFKLGGEDFEPTSVETRVTWTAPAPGNIHAAAAAATANATGADLNIDVEKNGTSIFSTELEIDSGTKVDDNTHALTSSPTSFSAGDVFEFDVSQAVISGATGVHVDLQISWS